MIDQAGDGRVGGGIEHDRGLTRERIVWAYRILFDRDPESEKVILDAESYGSMERLRTAILESPEFRGRRAPDAFVPQYLPLTSLPLDIELRADEATSAALLARVAKVWETLGEERPHWSVLSSEEFTPGRIAATMSEFYRSGAVDVAELVATLVRVGVDLSAIRTVFEFGCGVGRVTAHLAKRFPEIVACDVSPSHIRLAEAIIQSAEIQNTAIARARMPEFGMTRPFDLWFSRIVLQHNPPPIMASILQRALHLLNPGGVAVFQVPTYAPAYRFSLADYMSKVGGSEAIEMHALPQSEIFGIAQRNGCIPLEVIQDGSIGVPGWISSVFVLRRERGGSP